MEIANKRAENQLMSEVAANLQHLQEIVKYDTNSVTWTVFRFPGLSIVWEGVQFTKVFQVKAMAFMRVHNI